MVRTGRVTSEAERLGKHIQNNEYKSQVEAGTVGLCLFVILALGSQRQEDCHESEAQPRLLDELQIRMGCIAWPVST